MSKWRLDFTQPGERENEWDTICEKPSAEACKAEARRWYEVNHRRIFRIYDPAGQLWQESVPLSGWRMRWKWSYPQRTARGRVTAWIPVGERLPDTSAPVLAHNVGKHGESRILRAMYARQFELDAGEDASESWAEQREEDGEFYCPEGWYECNDHDGTYWEIDGRVTHWMPLPEPPEVV